MIFGSPYRATVKKEISSVKNRKEALLETALCSVISSQLHLYPQEEFSMTVLVEFTM